MIDEEDRDPGDENDAELSDDGALPTKEARSAVPSGVDAPPTPNVTELRAEMLRDRVPPWKAKQWGGFTFYTCVFCDTDFDTPGDCAEHARTQHNYQLLSPEE